MNKQDTGGTVRIASGPVYIEAIAERPPHPAGVVVFAHGSGSGRHSPRNNFVAAELRRARLATLLPDLLTPDEDLHYARRFDIDLLVERLAAAVRYLDANAATADLPLGVFGASTGAAAALRLAAAEPQRVQAVVCRGGRPDLAGAEMLARVRAPTLLIVGGLDAEVIDLNEAAFRGLGGPREMKIVPGATHLFDEPGTLEQVAALAADWFGRHLAASARVAETVAES